MSSENHDNEQDMILDDTVESSENNVHNGLNICFEIANIKKLLKLIYNFNAINEFGGKPEINRTLIEYQSNYKNGGDFRAKYKQIIYRDVGPLGRFYAYKNGKKTIDIENEEFAVNGYSICGIKREARNYICNEFCIDLDIKNCLPTLLQQLCEKKGFVCKELNYYVMNRDAVLQKYGVDKQYVCSLLFNKNQSGMNQFFTNIHDFVYKRVIPGLQNDNEYKKFYQNRKKHAKKKDNFEGSFISVVLQDIEVKIIQQVIAQLNQNGIQISAYMFDGLLLYKNDQLNEEYLKTLSNVVEEKLGYKVDFIFKDMEYPQYFDQLEDAPDKFEDSLKKNDDYCYAISFLNNKDIVARDKDTKTLWLKDEDNTWTCDEKRKNERFVYYFEIFGFPKKSRENIKKLIEAFSHKYVAVQDFEDTLFVMDYNFFENGGYSYIDKKFYSWKELDAMGIKTDVALKYDYVEVNEKIKETIKYIYDVILYPIFDIDDNTPEDDNKRKVMNEFLKVNTRYLAGHYEDKDWAVGLGVRHTGKAILTLLYTLAFKPYVGTFETKNLCIKATEGSDVEYANKWRIPFAEKRIMFGNEIPENKKIDNTMLKSIASGGDDFQARKAAEHIRSYKMRALSWIFTNDLPDSDKDNADCFQNMLYFTFPCAFVDDVEKEKSQLYTVKKKNGNLKSDIQKIPGLGIAFFHLIKEYYEVKKPVYEMLKKESDEAKQDGDNIADTLKDIFDIDCSNDSKLFTSTSDIIKELANHNIIMGSKKLKFYLTRMGLKPPKKTNKCNGYCGIGLKQVDDNNLEQQNKYVQNVTLY